MKTYLRKLFCLLGKLANRAICFTFCNFFSFFTGPIFTFFFIKRWVHCRWSIWTYFSDSLKDVAMAINFRQKWQNDLHSPGWHSKTDSNMAVPVQKIQWHYFTASCAYFMKIGPVAAEITRVTNAPFRMRWKKSAYSTKSLNNLWTRSSLNFQH